MQQKEKLNGPYAGECSLYGIIILQCYILSEAAC